MLPYLPKWLNILLELAPYCYQQVAGLPWASPSATLDKYVIVFKF
jgi:hypothetical protein